MVHLTTLCHKFQTLTFVHIIFKSLRLYPHTCIMVLLFPQMMRVGSRGLVDKALDSRSKDLMPTVDHVQKCWVNFSFHIASAYVAIIGTWWWKLYMMFMGSCGPADRVLNSRSKGLRFDSHC